MKKIVCIVMTAMLLAVLGTSSVFATASDGFKLTDCNPEDGYNRVQATNVMIKLFFSDDVSGETTQKANENMFKFTDGDGENVPFEIYYNEKDSKNICLLATEDLKEDTEYTVVISGDLQNDEGGILGADKAVEFKTKKPDSMLVYTLLMVAMIVLMVVMTFRDQKKAMEAENSKGQAAAAVIHANPYKLAREKNISVEEALKIIEAEKAKAAKKVEKAEKEKEKQNKQMQQEEKASGKKKQKPKKKVYKVKTRRITKKH